ncbi:MAG: carbohydrate binding family 9 domain-containing protein, partial [Phaeodactylibacter sp.]|nr:carbohydrate binding family 9 domain-containing protein [Phaeodactylibacter sp.]
LDGALDEPAWQNAQPVADFFQNFPFDTSYAVVQTEARLVYDDIYLYIGATIFEPRADYLAASLKRDFSHGTSDEFAVNIDPFKDKVNGFHFAVSPFNVQREGLIDNGKNIPLDWDNKWYSEVRNYDGYWVVEIAIPFKTLRYKLAEGSNTWRINFVTTAIRQNERSSWVPAPRQFEANDLAFAGVLEWQGRPPRPGLNVSAIPYILAGTERDYEFKLPGEQRFNAGVDAKVAITPSLNLDLTVNPDFSQVEVDRQLANLSRFELFFPERRQFFLENEDLFSRFGFPNSRPFFSRRIGLARGTISRTTTDGQLVEVERTLNVPIIAGARLSGKLDDNWRIGLLNMQTAKLEDIDLGPANYSVGVLQRKVFDRSYVGAVFVNKQNFLERPDGSYKIDPQGYNRVAGIEYNLFSKDNKWEAELFYHRSFSDGDNRDAQAAAVFLGHYTRHWSLFLPSQYIGENHRADMGFVPRTGFFSFSPKVSYNIFPKNPWLAKRVILISAAFGTDFTLNKANDFAVTDRSIGPELSFEFPGQSRFFLSASQDYTFLFFPFDPTNSGGQPLPENTDYTYYSYGLGYDSDVRRKFFFDIGAATGTYYNGRIFQMEGSFNYRLQPIGIFAVSYTYNDINLPGPYSSASFWLVGPRAELSFSRSLFFSTFLQYNTQANNVNINSRIQWRFRPVSDVFLVYTDNYFSNQFFQEPRAKNRALVLKVNYWLNL